MNISDEAVEAAAKIAHYEFCPCGGAPDCIADYSEEAQRILEAAAPHLMASATVPDNELFGIIYAVTDNPNWAVSEVHDAILSAGYIRNQYRSAGGRE